jgi:nickel transport protein
VANLTGDMDIVIKCGDGHRGSWHLEEDDYLFTKGQPTGHVHTEPKSIADTVPNKNDDVLRQIVADEVEKKIAPLRRELAQLAEHQTSLQDILGGIGYLLGLAGLAAYMKYKKSK